MNTFVDQTKTPDSPGSEDMSPVAMQCDSLPQVTEPTEGSVVKPIEMNMDDLDKLINSDPPFASGPPDSWWREKDLERILQAKTEEAAVSEAEHFLRNWYQFDKEEFEQLKQDAASNGQSYAEAVLQAAASEGSPYREHSSTQEEEGEIKTLEHLAKLQASAKKHILFAQQQAGQPMQQSSTQPPKGVTNLAGGSTGSQGSAPGTEKPTAGGTVGTTPTSTPTKPGVGKPPAPNTPASQTPNQNMNQNANQPAQTVANQESIDNLFDDEDVLPPDDKILLTEFKSPS